MRLRYILIIFILILLVGTVLGGWEVFAEVTLYIIIVPALILLFDFLTDKS